MVVVCFKNVERLKTVGALFSDGYYPAFNLEMAKRAVRRIQPRLLLLDVFAGGSTLRAVDVVPQLAPFAPVVITTPWPTPAAIAHAQSLGAAGCVFRYSKTLAEDVERVLEGHRQREELVAVGLRSRSFH